MNRPRAQPRHPVSIARGNRPTPRDKISRAQLLADRQPAVADPLNFYANVLKIQQQLIARWPALDPGPMLAPVLPNLVASLTTIARPTLASELNALSRDDDWSDVLDDYWRSGGRVTNDVSELSLLVIDTLIAPFAERRASAQVAAAISDEHPYDCPYCKAPPALAVLREESHGAKRTLLCSWCLHEWGAPRLLCITCGESDFNALPVFSAEELATVRVDVCLTCQVYIKTIDMTRDASAVPLVDDLATLALDLWARDSGYRRLRPNVLRI